MAAQNLADPNLDDPNLDDRHDYATGDRCPAVDDLNSRDRLDLETDGCYLNGHYLADRHGCEVLGFHLVAVDRNLGGLNLADHHGCAMVDPSLLDHLVADDSNLADHRGFERDDHRHVEGDPCLYRRIADWPIWDWLSAARRGANRLYADDEDRDLEKAFVVF